MTSGRDHEVLRQVALAMATVEGRPILLPPHAQLIKNSSYQFKENPSPPLHNPFSMSSLPKRQTVRWTDPGRDVLDSNAFDQLLVDKVSVGSRSR